MKKRESSNFRSPEVDISVIMSKSRGVLPYTRSNHRLMSAFEFS